MCIRDSHVGGVFFRIIRPRLNASKEHSGNFFGAAQLQMLSKLLFCRIKARPDDPEKYATYVAHRMKPGENNNILCIGAPGSYKSCLLYTSPPRWIQKAVTTSS